MDTEQLFQMLRDMMNRQEEARRQRDEEKREEEERRQKEKQEKEERRQKEKQEEEERRQKEKQEEEERRQKEKQEEEERRQKEKQEEEERRQKEKQEEEERRQKEKQGEEERRQKEKQEEEERRQKEKQEEIECRQMEAKQQEHKFQMLLQTITGKTEEVRVEMQSRFAEVERGTANIEKKLNNKISEKEKKFEKQLETMKKEMRELLESQPQRKIFEARTPHSLISPPVFDGSSAWSTYRLQFEAASKANGWSDQEKATALLVSLKGPALELLQTMSSDHQSDFSALIGALELRYGDQYRQQLYQSQLENRLQKANESLQEFESEVRRLAHLAYPSLPEDVKEQFITRYFVRGVRDIEVQKMLHAVTFRRSSEALVKALELESAFNSTSKPKVRAVSIQEEHGSRVEENANVLLNEIRAVLNKIETISSEIPRTGRQQQSRRCFRCGRVGHFMRDCQASPRARTPSRDRQSRSSPEDRRLTSYGRTRSPSPDRRRGLERKPRFASPRKFADSNQEN